MDSVIASIQLARMQSTKLLIDFEDTLAELIASSYRRFSHKTQLNIAYWVIFHVVFVVC